MPINVLLKCLDLDETCAYYKDVLAFDDPVVDPATATATLRKEDCTLIFTTADNVGGDPAFSGTFYLFVDDVDGYYDRIKSAADVTWELQDMPYGTREFGITDLNGYRLAFAQKN